MRDVQSQVEALRETLSNRLEALEQHLAELHTVATSERAAFFEKIESLEGLTAMQMDVLKTGTLAMAHPSCGASGGGADAPRGPNTVRPADCAGRRQVGYPSHVHESLCGRCGGGTSAEVLRGGKGLSSAVPPPPTPLPPPLEPDAHGVPPVPLAPPNP